MLFYRVEGIVTKAPWMTDHEEIKSRDRIRREISDCCFDIDHTTRDFNEKCMSKHHAQIFIADIRSIGSMELGLIMEETKTEPKKITESFLDELSIELKDICFEEMTCKDFERYADHAARNHYLDDDEEFLMNFGIIPARGPFRDIRFDENIIHEKPRQEVYKEV